MASFPYLVPAAIGLSLIGGAAVMLVGRWDRTGRGLALGFSLPPLLISTYALLAIWLGWEQAGANGYYFYMREAWIPGLGVNFIFGLDGVSAPLFFLTTLLVTLGIVFQWDEKKNPHLFHGFLLFVNVAVLGVFAALDLFVFYVFWEFSLIPMYFLIAMWGGPRRKYAAIKFFLYTFIASLVMLLGFLALYFTTGVKSFALEDLTGPAAALGTSLQKWIFIALFIGFAVKFPIVPFHTWLPDAHVEAPTSGSVILAGVLLKMGGYGLIRLGLPLAPVGAKWAVPLMLVIGVLSVLYPALICLVQRDYKRLVAYSSIGSMGLVLLGIAAAVATGNPIGLVGALFMMFAHGLFSPALFMLCGVLHHNLGTRDIPLMGGLGAKLPKTGTFLVFMSMAGVGLPGLAVFVAEFQIFAGLWDAFGIFILVPAIYLALSAGYYLWALQRSVMGPFEEKPGVDYHLYDMHAFELWPLVIIAGLLVLYGVYPAAFTGPVADPVAQLMGTIAVGGA